jgi:hypothetical protein
MAASGFGRRGGRSGVLVAVELLALLVGLFLGFLMVAIVVDW